MNPTKRGQIVYLDEKFFSKVRVPFVVTRVRDERGTTCVHTRMLWPYDGLVFNAEWFTVEEQKPGVPLRMRARVLVWWWRIRFALGTLLVALGNRMKRQG